MQDVPANLRSAAILQIVSGLLNMFVVTGIAYFAVSTFCGLATFFVGGLGACLAPATCMLWPIGLFEVVAGAMTLANPRGGASMMKLAMYVEFVSVFFGGLLSAVAGGVVMSLLKDAEVKAYLEG